MWFVSFGVHHATEMTKTEIRQRKPGKLKRRQKNEIKALSWN